MAPLTIVEKLGFDRAIGIDADVKKISDGHAAILQQVKDFGIDEVYFCTGDNQNSYPAVFIKKVLTFDIETLKAIAATQRQIWNYKKVLFLYVYTDFEIRIYNCAEKPFVIKNEGTDFENELQELELTRCLISDASQLALLDKVFSAVAIDTGIIWTAEEAELLRKKINLQRRVDKYLVDSLIKTAKQLQDDGLNIGLIHKIIMRSLFLLYLEDRGATDESFYQQIKPEAKSYFGILDDVRATYALYKKLEDHFNGNVFTLDPDEFISKEQLQLIKKCFINGNDGTSQIKLFESWRLFDFSIIQIELLSEIYENFLAEIEPDIKQQTGTYYTPPSLVELILNEKLPVNNKESNYNVKILDPACGSGIFLVESFKCLVKRYENKHKQKLTDFDTLKKLLTDNIFGVELHPQSIKVAAFSLYLALVDNLNPKTIWQEKGKQLPYLINDLKDSNLREQGKNLFCRDTIEDNIEIESMEFDLVVGNPPFGTKTLLPSIRKYCDRFGFAKEMVLPFIHKATKFSPNGEIVLIFNTKVLTNTTSTYQKFRQWLFNDCYVEKIYNFSILRNVPESFGGQLFGSATGPISIVFYKKNPPIIPSEKITYYSPKTFVKSNVVEGVVIDSFDLKYLPRNECRNPNTKIWKIAMWGTMADLDLINRLTGGTSKTIKNYTTSNKIESSVGFQPLTQEKDEPKYSSDLARMPYLDAGLIRRYYTDKSYLTNVIKAIKTPKTISFYKKFYNVEDISSIKELSAYRRLGDEKSFKAPHIVVKKGLEENSVCASVLDQDCSFREGVYGFYCSNENSSALKVLTSYFNSKLSSYYLFMTISSYGIEREQIMKNEYLSIPINLDGKQMANIADITESILVDKRNETFLKYQVDEPYFNEEIEKIIHESLGLDYKDSILINDTINYGLDLFHKKEKSKALLPVVSTVEYANMLCEEINEFLESPGLYVNPTVYSINRFSPLMVIKITFGKERKKIYESTEDMYGVLKKIDGKLWEQKSTNIYFRKKLNYKNGKEIFIIRPNQKRFWTRTMAIEDASELILEILNDH